MLDVKAIQLRDFAKVTKLDYLDEDSVREFFDMEALGLSTLPIILVAEGTNFARAAEVLVNGSSSQFTIVDDKRMFITLSKVVASQQLTSVVVLTDKETFSSSSLFSFELGGIPGLQSGPSKLIAQYVKLLLTTPGSDSFDKSSGGGLQKIPGSVSQPQHMALAQVAIIMNKVGEQIISRQDSVNLPNSEKLRSVEVVRLGFAKGDPTHIEVMIKLKTMDGASLPAAILLGAQNLVQDLLG